jgi:3-oxoacyl-(acyl-carrier-protein) synthase
VNCAGDDPACDLDYVREGVRQKEMTNAMSINRGWGGQNCVFVTRRL